MSAFFQGLKVAIQRRPVLFNSLAGCTLCAASDAGAQQMEHPDSPGMSLDLTRFLSAGILGIFFGGFVYPTAYAKLDAIWTAKTFRSILTKSVVEIATVGVFVNTMSMMSRGLLEGRSREDVLQHVMNEMPRVTFNDVRVWLPYNLLAFSVIPAFIRPTTTAFMEASWQTYISLRSHDYQHQQKVELPREIVSASDKNSIRLVPSMQQLVKNEL